MITHHGQRQLQEERDYSGYGPRGIKSILAGEAQQQEAGRSHFHPHQVLGDTESRGVQEVGVGTGSLGHRKW